VKAVVMAGGEGTRLRPLTSSQPKPMVPIVGKPCIEHVLELLRRHDLREVIVTLAFMPQAIRTYFGDGEALEMELEYSVEELPLGTAGSVRLAGERLDDTFLVISGDAVCDVDLGALVASHRSAGAAVTLGLKSVADPLEYGIVVTGDEGRVERFHEKPSWGQVFTDTINTGIYVVEPEVLSHVPAGRPFDFSQDLFPLLLETGVPLHGHVLDGYWHDIGTLAELRTANFDALDGRVRLEIPGLRLPGNVWVAEDAALRDLEPVGGPAFVGPNCRIAEPGSIGPYTVLSGGVVLGPGAQVSHSVLGARVHVGRGALVEGAIVGNDADLGDHTRIHEDVAIGDQVTIGAEATVFPGVRVYPFKRIDSGSQIHESVVWESRGTASVFGRDGVLGRVDVDLTPELAVRIASALGTALPAGSRVVASRDASDACRMIERAIIAGLSSTGVDVADLRVSPSAVTRHVLKTQALAAGVHVGRAGNDPERLQVRVFEPPGIQMGDRLRKLVERQFSRQELRRAAAPDVGATTYPARVRESYAQDLLDGIDAERVRERGFRVAIDFGHSAASFTLPLVLGPLGVDAIGLHGFLADAPDLPELGTDDVRRIVTAVGADLGVVVDRAAERLRLVDERGEEIPPELGLLLVVRLLALAGRDGVVAVPVTASSLVDSVAEGSGIVVRRTAHSIAALTAAAAESGVLCAAAPTGGFVFPDVVAGYDAVGALCKLLELLAILDRPLSAVVAELPRPTLVTDSAPCPLGRKGGVMRVLGEQLADRRLELLDGVKAYDHRGSVQAIPDQIEPVIHVFAEGRTRVESLALAREVLATIDAALEAGRQGGADGRRTSDQVST
jgi:mannose-1-phosphate guanylyltransferase/phosphomannomutase